MEQKVPLAPYYMFAATLIGFGDTLWLSYEKFIGVIPACAIGGCNIVLTSQYSSFLGIPIAYFGLVFYTYLLGLVLLIAMEPRSKALKFGALIYTGIGLLFSLRFEFLQLFVIKSICLYCTTSAILALILFSLAVWHWRSATRR